MFFASKKDATVEDGFENYGIPSESKYYSGNKYVGTVTDLTTQTVIASDLLRAPFSMSEAQALTLDWRTLDFDAVFSNGWGISHSKRIGGINVLTGSMSVEKKQWSQVKLRYRQYNGGFAYYYW